MDINPADAPSLLSPDEFRHVQEIGAVLGKTAAGNPRGAKGGKGGKAAPKAPTRVSPRKRAGGAAAASSAPAGQPGTSGTGASGGGAGGGGGREIIGNHFFSRRIILHIIDISFMALDFQCTLYRD